MIQCGAYIGSMNNITLYVAIVLIWGSTWLAIEYQLGVVAPEVSVFYRYALAAIALFAWSGARRLPMRFGLTAHVKFVLLGFFMFSFNYILAYHAQRFVTSALIAIAFSTLLWMNIINARLFFGVRACRNVLIGAVLGVIGIALMFWPSVASLSLGDATVLGALLGLAGTYSASIGNMVSQAAQKQKLPILQSNAWGMLYGALFTALIVVAKGEAFTFDPSVRYVSALLYLTVIGSIVGFGVYLKLLGQIGAHKAGYVTVMFPVVAIALSVLFEGMTLDPVTGLGIGIALLGNVFVMRREPTPAAVPVPVQPAKVVTHCRSS